MCRENEGEARSTAPIGESVWGEGEVPLAIKKSLVGRHRFDGNGSVSPIGLGVVSMLDTISKAPQAAGKHPLLKGCVLSDRLVRDCRPTAS